MLVPNFGWAQAISVQNPLLVVVRAEWMLVDESVVPLVVLVEVQRYSVAPETVIGSSF